MSPRLGSDGPKNAIRLPSGDQAGSTLPLSEVTWRWPVPSLFMVQISFPPVRLLTKAILGH